MMNSRDIDLLRSDVATNCHVFVERCRKAGLPVLVTGTVRDKEFQEHCFLIGTAKTKTPSFHSVEAGLAFDICKNVKGQEYSDLAFFDQCAVIGKEMGFEWGGDWKSFVDRPHFQWAGQNKEYTSAMILRGEYPPLMPQWKEEIEMIETEEETPMSLEEAKALVQEKTGFSNATIEFLNNYRFAESLFEKLAKAMK